MRQRPPESAAGVGGAGKLGAVRRSRKLCVVTTIGVTALLGAFSSSASAATWAPCTFAEVAIDCATYDMPLDRSGVFPGATKVRAMRMAAPEGPRMGTLFVIAGGPGQGSQAMMELMSSLFGGANRYDVIAIDQRGSGYSEPLNCPRIESGDFRFDGADPRTDWAITQCADAIGGSRIAYNTAEAVADLEAVREDLALGPVSLFGVSYGTKVAMAYAKTYPATTRSLLLDSLVPTEEPSSFDTDSIAALRRALGEICARRACRGINTAPVSGLAKVASRLAREPIPAFSVSTTGRIVETKIDDAALFEIILQADFNLFFYNQLPGAITRALRGDYAQIARLYAIATGSYSVDFSQTAAKRAARKAPGPAKSITRKPGKRINGRDAELLAAFSNTMNVATTCADFNPPWARGDDLSGRQEAIVAAANAIPDATFSPFSRGTIRDNSLATICRGWRQSATAPAIPAGPLPTVPTLALNGSLDLRTPNAWAERSIAGNPAAQLAIIPATGHSVIGTDASGCALSLAKRFLIFGATDGKCTSKAATLPIAPLPSGSINSVSTPRGSCRGVSGRRCAVAKRKVAAGYLAMRDAIDQLVLGNMFDGPGLYSGAWYMDFDISEDLTELIPVSITMSGLSNVAGTSVSGSLDLTTFPNSGGRLRVSDDTGRDYRITYSGRIAYDRADDRLVLQARRGKERVTIRIGGRSRARASKSFAVSQKSLKLRANYGRAVGLAPNGSFAR